MKEHKTKENVISIVCNENTESSGIDYDLFFNNKLIDGGIVTGAKTMSDILDFISTTYKQDVNN